MAFFPCIIAFIVLSKQKKFNKNNKKIMVEIFDDIFIELEEKND